MSSLILVVDDERAIRDLVEQHLTSQGYRVVTANNGDEAIETFRRLYPRPDLAVIDVVMPGMSGPMLADKLREMDAHVPVLFMSGFHERQVVQRYVLEEGFRILQKPFSLRTLKEAVQQAADTAPPAAPENYVH